jgi:chromate reductase, NAD(P)H dehydrogenase (quinone)
MKILGISGSLKSTSSNTSILHASKKLMKENMDLTIYNHLGNLPHFNPDMDGHVPPDFVKEFRDALKEADGVLISTPEYAFGIPGLLKNALDWTVSSGEFVDKPVAVITASPSTAGGDKALTSLLSTLSALSANVPEEGSLAIPDVYSKIDADNNFTDIETAQQIRSLLDALGVIISANPENTSTI